MEEPTLGSEPPASHPQVTPDPFLVPSGRSLLVGKLGRRQDPPCGLLSEFSGSENFIEV